MKGLDQDEPCFGYIGRTMPGISTEKVKAGTFNDPGIRQLINDPDRFHSFVDSLSVGEGNVSLLLVLTKLKTMLS